MGVDDAIEAMLSQFQWAGIKLGLERVQQLLADLGSPHKQVPIVHVAGTNGKGSVCAYLSSICTAAGYRVGRYTSPHLVSWCERICINDVPIAPTDLIAILEQVNAAIRNDSDPPSQFEVITAAAWLYFQQQRVDIAVMEVGLGGRLDATNVCDRPLVSVITSISRDHAHILGETLAKIAYEKAGILKPDCPTVIAPQPPEVEAVLRQRLAEMNCPALFAQPSVTSGNGWATYHHTSYPQPLTLNPQPLTLNPQPSTHYPLPLPGTVQLTNSAVAIATIHLLNQQGWHIDETAIVKGMATTTWRGRLEWTTYRGHRLLIDGAHNIAGIEALRHYVDQGMDWRPTSIHWVMGMMGRKDHADMLQALVRSGDRLHLVPIPDSKTADPTTLATLAQQICPDLLTCQAYPDLFTALDQAYDVAGNDPHSLVVLCGSLYLLGHFLHHIA